ncbi:MAG: hypothetical protein V3W20_07045 [Candidatus Neomarinimicrobiota bacterium]
MPNCRPDIPAYLDIAGCDVEGGSVVAFAFIEDSVVFDETNDITDPTNWENLTYASDILIHKEVRGSYAKPAPTEIPGKGKQDTRVVGRKHEVTFRVASVKGNDDYWNALNKATNYTCAFVIGSNYDLLYYVNVNISIDSASDVQEGLDTEVDWMVSIKWSDFDVPSTSNVPAGIFEP